MMDEQRMLCEKTRAHSCPCTRTLARAGFCVGMAGVSLAPLADRRPINDTFPLLGDDDATVTGHITLRIAWESAVVPRRAAGGALAWGKDKPAVLPAPRVRSTAEPVRGMIVEEMSDAL